MAVRVSVKVDTRKAKWLRKNSAEGIRVTADEMGKALRLVLLRGREIAQKLSPVGATANLKGSIVTRVDKRATVQAVGTLRWQAPYASTVDKGGPPRRVSIAKLKAWAAAVLGNEKLAYPIQKNIQKQGTPSPNHPKPGLGMSERTEAALSPHIQRLFDKAADNIARRLN